MASTAQDSVTPSPAVATLALLRHTAANWNISLSNAQIQQFVRYAAEVRQWNERVNLTAITDPEAFVVRHVLDSLRCSCSWGKTPHALIDVGSGAGFPGVPLKIAFPALRLTLVESVRKKADFLEHLVGACGLDGVTVVQARAEQVGHDPQHRERYDVATARAVADLRVLAEYCLPLVRVGGYFLAPKGAEIDAEVAAAHQAVTTLGGYLLAVEPVALPGVARPRTLVVIGKTAPSPPGYPRRVGVPARRPL